MHNFYYQISVDTAIYPFPLFFINKNYPLCVHAQFLMNIAYLAKFSGKVWTTSKLVFQAPRAQPKAGLGLGAGGDCPLPL